jgi:hypothetical protein
MDGESQSRIVAAYEVNLQIEGVISAEQADEMRRASGRK